LNKNWIARIAINNHIVRASAAAKAASIDFIGIEISNRVIIGLSQDEQSQLEKAARELVKSNGAEVHHV